MLKPGDKFPAFSLPDQNGENKNLSDFLGRPTVFFFYPKDLTSGCTTEACEFNEVLTTHEDFNVVGVSPDPAKMHIKFIAKHQLTYPLLSDEDKVLLTKLGIWVEKSMYGKKYMGVERTTIAVDAQGIITQIWNKVKPAGHAAEVAKALTALSG